jgi:hypothetical protein
VVFVDDLDRVRPELLPDLLLNLREALNLPNVHYVLGVSPQVVEQGLSALHKGWDNAGNFLEKIVEYPAWSAPILCSTVLFSLAACLPVPIF